MEKLYEQICAAVREAGAIVLQATAEGKNVREKTSRHDLVTAYDARVQRFLQERLLALLPEAGFLGEEDGGRLESASAWRFIVDPIDGTMNFIRTLRRSCISVGLARATGWNSARSTTHITMSCSPPCAARARFSTARRSMSATATWRTRWSTSAPLPIIPTASRRPLPLRRS